MTQTIRGGQRVDARGIRRRLQALSRIGWSMAEFGKVIGASYRPLMKIRKGDQTKISIELGVAIVKGYEKCSMEVRTGQYANIAAELAKKKGWPPPLAWDNIDTEEHIPKDS